MPTLPCSTIIVTPIRIINLNHQLPNSRNPQTNKLSGDAAGATPPVPVLHLEESFADSFIELNYTKKLCADAFQETPPIDEHTRIVLRWHYPALNTVTETTHRVLTDIAYPVILQRDDWIEPIKRLWFHEQQRLQTDCPPLQDENDEDRGLRAESVTDDGVSSSWGRSSPAPSCSSCGHDDWQSSSGVSTSWQRNWRQSHDIELVDSDPQERRPQANDYWDWDRETQKWFHQNPDGTIIPFPELD